MADFYLSGLNTKNDLKKIIIEKWNYEPVFHPFPTSYFNDQTLQKIKNTEVISEYLGFQLVLFELCNTEKPKDVERFLRVTEREIITQIPVDKRNDILFVFSFDDGNWWHFVAVDSFGSRVRLKRFIIDPENRQKLRTASQQLDLIKIEPDKDITTQKVKSKFERAFSVESLTDDFYENYKKVFDRIKSHILSQKLKSKDSVRDAHLYVHQLLNRIMFLYFVQKKGCFRQNKEFMKAFWDVYRNNFEGKNKFHSLWLNVLFFEALSQPSYLFKQKDYFAKCKEAVEFNQVLKNAPYLNGGLFNRNELDLIEYQIEDDYFKDVYDFFESYNFTVQESTPLDQDIAIDPEMLGNIYEMMVNVTEEDDERHQAGIFYTPKLEIELMLRRSLVEFLFKKTKIDKDKLYQFVLKEKENEVIPVFSDDGNKKILEELEDIKIVDPACGSGHYLVVATQILYELKEHLYSQRSKTTGRFTEKKNIIEKSIYGVDVKEWATQIAKLRLWLELFVDADEARLKNTSEALLPSLSFKIRVGDSLVQSLGKSLVPLRRLKAPTSQLKERIRQLAQHKSLAYQNKYSDEKVIIEERKILTDILSYSRIKIQQEIQTVTVSMGKQEIQPDWFKKASPEKRDLFSEQREKKLEELRQKLNQIDAFLEEMKRLEEPPLIWDIGFSDIFSDTNGKSGFDIVIANPPYVRQELIVDPKKDHSTTEEKKEYKRKLLEQIQYDWDDYYGRLIRINKQADLYVYFYLKGLQLLNTNGIFCYISSNSWLDVEYGGSLQEILLKRTPILAIYDNQAKRSFKHADVNTIIIILGAPRTKDWEDDLKTNIVKFVSFKKPFEEIFYTEVFTEIEKIRERKETDLFRVRSFSQHKLYIEGLEEETGKSLEFEKEHKGIYVGDKWGGKYLRAPDIYFTILEKGKDKLVRLGDIAEVRRGFTTGANEFFYLDDEKIREWGIEKEFLKPVIFSLKELTCIKDDMAGVSNKMIWCHKPKEQLKGTSILTYIQWGESQKFHKRPTCKGRNLWYSIGKDWSAAPLIFPAKVGERMLVLLNSKCILEDKKLYGITPKTKIEAWLLVVLLNSTLTRFFMDLSCRQLTGAQAIADIDVGVVEELPILNPSKIGAQDKEYIEKIFNSFKSRPIKMHVEEEYSMPDRQELDRVIFKNIDLEQKEFEEIHRNVVALVQSRLKKAKNI